MWKLLLLQSLDEIPTIVEEATVHGDNVAQAVRNCENLICGAYPAYLITFDRTSLTNVISGMDVFISVSMEVDNVKFVHNALIYSVKLVSEKES